MVRTASIKLLGAATLFFGVAAANASTITITNPSFENPQIAPATNVIGTLNGWSLAGGNTGTTTQADTGLTPVDGNQMAFVNLSDNALINGTSQTLGTNFQAYTTYTLSAYFGWRGDNLAYTGLLQLYAGGTALAGLVSGGTLVQEAQVTTTQGTFVLGSLTYTTTATDPAIGQVISIRLGGEPVISGPHQADIDLVTLTATAVPEPASMGLLGLGLVGLGLASRVSAARRQDAAELLED
jgi:hypothetical protein